MIGLYHHTTIVVACVTTTMRDHGHVYVLNRLFLKYKYYLTWHTYMNNNLTYYGFLRNF